MRLVANAERIAEAAIPEPPFVTPSTPTGWSGSTRECSRAERR